MVTIEFTKRTPVNGYWLLPGTRAEFATRGQAGYFTNAGVARLVEQPKAKRKRERTTSTDAVPDTAANAAAGDAGGS